jgi:hypothetical protein
MINLVDFDQSKCPDFNPDYKFKACLSYDPANSPMECGFCKKTGIYYRCIADTQRCIPLSHSSVQNYLTCHHLYYLQAVRGIRVLNAATSSPLKCGKLWESVIQNYYGGLDKDTGKPFDIPAIIKDYEIDPKDVQKVRGLYRAYKMLEIQIDEGFEFQTKVDIHIDKDILVTGFYDRKYPTYFIENKFSGSPDRYLDPYFIQSQIGTYFLADPDLEYCIMEIVRNPALKSAGRYKEEDPKEYGERVYQDAISRPTHYFIGYDLKTHRYGKKYYRGEFDMEEIRHRYHSIYREIYNANRSGGWYKNDRACTNVLPGIACDMLPLCRQNNFNDKVYKIRERIEF